MLMAHSGCITQQPLFLKFGARQRGSAMEILELHDLRRSSPSAVAEREAGGMLMFGSSPRL